MGTIGHGLRWMVVVGLALASGCAHHVNVGYTVPAQVDLPADVETVLVVNRAVPKNAGETVLDAAEGWITGEGFETDHDTTELALGAVVEVLQETERFDVVRATVAPSAAGTSLFDRPLDTQTALRLCRRHDCDAIVSIDALDTDSAGSMTRTGDVHEGRTDSNIRATFRVVDGRTGQVLDQASLAAATSSENAGDRDTAAAAASQGAVHQADLSYGAGLDYGRRIAPHQVVSMRPYYTTGDPQLREARRAVKAGRWGAAKRIWRQLTKGDDPKLAAKAQYNLALAAEVEGRLERAHDLAREAAHRWGSGRNLRYVAQLGQRLEDQRRLEVQMAGVWGPPEAAAPLATLSR